MYNKILSIFALMSGVMITSSQACETTIDRDKNLVTSIFQVTHDGHPGKKTYLLPTRHANSDVSGGIVDFISANCTKVYFESNNQVKDCVEYDNEMWDRASKNQEEGILFPKIPDSGHFKETISKKNKEHHVSKAVQTAHNPELLQKCLDKDSEVDVWEELGKLIPKLDEHDKALVNFTGIVWDGDTEEDPHPLSPENQAILDEYNASLPKYQEQRASTEASNNLQISTSESDSDDPEITKDEISFAQNLPNFVDPIDLITLSIDKVTQNCVTKNMRQNMSMLIELQIPGTEHNLTEKLLQKSSTVSFSFLETASDILRGLREGVFENTDKEEPYAKWAVALDALKNTVDETVVKAIFGEVQYESGDVPGFLIKTLNDMLSLKRETRWLPIIEENFKEFEQGKGTIFAVGNAHIPSLSKKLEKEGYDIKELSLI